MCNHNNFDHIFSNMTLRELKIRHVQKLQYESVLVMQGGGSLGAYECGVYKALSKHGIKFGIVEGTSIGAVNAAIVAGSRITIMKKTSRTFDSMLQKLRPLR